jgi:hypothetical protein
MPGLHAQRKKLALLCGAEGIQKCLRADMLHAAHLKTGAIVVRLLLARMETCALSE